MPRSSADTHSVSGPHTRPTSHMQIVNIKLNWNFRGATTAASKKLTWMNDRPETDSREWWKLPLWSATDLLNHACDFVLRFFAVDWCELTSVCFIPRTMISIRQKYRGDYSNRVCSNISCLRSAAGTLRFLCNLNRLYFVLFVDFMIITADLSETCCFIFSMCLIHRIYRLANVVRLCPKPTNEEQQNVPKTRKILK